MVQDNTVDPLRFAAALRQLDPSARFALPALGERLIFFTLSPLLSGPGKTAHQRSPILFPCSLHPSTGTGC